MIPEFIFGVVTIRVISTITERQRTEILFYLECVYFNIHNGVSERDDEYFKISK